MKLLFILNLSFLCLMIGCTDIKKSETTDSFETELVESETSRDLMQEYCDSLEDLGYEKFGRWLDNEVPEFKKTLILYKFENKRYLLSWLHDNSFLFDELRYKESKKEFRIKGSPHVEWYVINKDGDLECYSQTGLYKTILCY